MGPNVYCWGILGRCGSGRKIGVDSRSRARVLAHVLRQKCSHKAAMYPRIFVSKFI